MTARAFFAAARADGRAFIVEVPRGRHVVLGPNGLITSPSEGPLADWDGERLLLLPGSSRMTIGGRTVDEAHEVHPGEDVFVDGVHLVLGIATPQRSGARRTLPHAGFLDRVAEELARAARAWRPTSIVMIETPPGQGGRVIEAALEGLRAGDCVGVFAPDHVELLLPDTDLEAAQHVARRTLQQAGVVGFFGIALAPDQGEKAVRLLHAARASLWSARGQVGMGSTPVSPALLANAADALAGGSLVVRGEPGVGRTTLARLAHHAAHPETPLHALRASRADRASLETLPTDGTLLIEGLDELRADLWDTLALMCSRRRAIATIADVERDRGALGFWLRSLPRVELPPLRDRIDELVPLALSIAERVTGGTPDLPPAALVRLQTYPWPGNLAELEVAMERACLLASGGAIQAEHLPGEALRGGASDGRLREAVDSVERDAIVRALADTNHNQTHAARLLGLSRRALIYKLEKYGLKAPPNESPKRPKPPAR